MNSKTMKIIPSSNTAIWKMQFYHNQSYTYTNSFFQAEVLDEIISQL